MKTLWNKHNTETSSICYSIKYNNWRWVPNFREASVLNVLDALLWLYSSRNWWVRLYGYGQNFMLLAYVWKLLICLCFLSTRKLWIFRVSVQIRSHKLISGPRFCIVQLDHKSWGLKWALVLFWYFERKWVFVETWEAANILCIKNVSSLYLIAFNFINGATKHLSIFIYTKSNAKQFEYSKDVF